MDPAVPAAAPPGLPVAQAPVLVQAPGQEGPGNERGTYLWRPWLSSTNDQLRQAAGGATAAEAAKADSEFHHPVRLFWPKSCAFDYLYSAGEILLQNFPVQATINLYEDSDSEEDEEDKEDNDEEETDEKGPEGCVRVPVSTPHKATAHSPDPPLTCPN
ncbi:protein ripply1 isoform X2 [Nannospalax galili]|uniref:protein ripply1 isoform X2 n=1 Tax=Nannospalax galili TaxID=1026970 RepID=UPI00111BF950|nr:protein ripply1 isoform X2 [Nannospalax galili]